MNMPKADSIINLTKFILREMGYYQPQYRRPYSANLTAEGMSLAHEAFHGIRTFTPTECAPMVSEFLDIRALPSGEAYIDGGWGKARFSFLMELDVQLAVGSQITQVIQGYTSPIPEGMTPGDFNIDALHDLTFYINTTYQVRRVSDSTPLGNKEYSVLHTPQQVLVNRTSKGQPSDGENYQRVMRPSDVYSSIQALQLASMSEANGMPLIDARNYLSNNAMLSDVTNNIPSYYASKVFSSFSNAIQVCDDATGGISEVYHHARGYASESHPQRNPFMRALSYVAECPMDGTMRYADLAKMFPNIGVATNVSLVKDARNTERATAEKSSPLYDQNLTTVTAVRVHHLVVNLMRVMGLTHAVISTTNTVVDNVPVLVVHNTKGMGDKPEVVDRFKQQLQHELKHYITYGNMVEIALDVSADIFGETWVSLSINAGATVGFIFPTFADSTFSPVILSSREEEAQHAQVFEAMLANFDWLTSMRQAV